ncbi:MAG: tetratricopeptide repeat protein [Polaribacter sp.]
MKKILYPLFLFILLASCTSQKNSEDFIKATEGRYLMNANEVIEIYFKEQTLHVKWRGNDDIELLKVNDSAFYMKELNEKMLFVSKPEMHIQLAPKREHDSVKYHFKKMELGEKTPYEYFEEKDYDKALNAYQKIQKKDSLNPIIRLKTINRQGYRYIREDNFDAALEIFKINAVLYPKSSNVFNSLGEAYFLKKDTVSALANFKKSLSINPENRNSKRFIKKLTKK